jgi:hypothetical protein
MQRSVYSDLMVGGRDEMEASFVRSQQQCSKAQSLPEW